ncbi:MAG: hypothetical protein OXE77_01125 [Flavobacteriaceae bacterium]|nr:hypothetical protein [Flavobacteriaceae bacterium]MCY4267659.1 hypothetical protein [Flavobacteriaceae bacterium]MCY4299982.1 hypothetical protein [Flavobacteriaceae bacterium]
MLQSEHRRGGTKPKSVAFSVKPWGYWLFGLMDRVQPIKLQWIAYR